MAPRDKFTDIEATTIRRAGIAAGIAYLFGLLQGFALAFPANAVLFVAGDTAATVHNITVHELLFRISILNELIMYLGVIVIAVALFVIVRTVSKNLALLGLSLRLAEAILSIVAVLGSFIVLEVLKGGFTGFSTEQVQALAQTFLNVHTVGTQIGLLFTGLGSIVFYWLFFKARYIPRILSGFGLLAYLLMIAAVIVDVLTPGGSSKALSTSVLEFAPVILFETAVGLWFVVKGVRLQPK